MTHYKKQAKQGRGLNFEALKFELNITISGSINAQEKTVNGISVSYKKRYGWLFFFSQLNDYSVLYNLDVFVQKKIKHIFPTLSNEKINEIYSFVKCFRDVKYNPLESQYIFYPDKFSQVEKKDFLTKVCGISTVNVNSTDEIDQLFKRRFFKILSKNEQDLINGFS